VCSRDCWNMLPGVSCSNEGSYVKNCRGICLEGLRRTVRNVSYVIGVLDEGLQTVINNRRQLLVTSSGSGVFREVSVLGNGDTKRWTA
jgi:hypothetical protein